MQRILSVIILGLIFPALAFAQSTGIIQCDPGSTNSVPAWSAPGKPHVVEQLSCGQTVIVLEMGGFFAVSQYSSRPREYAKIQIGEKAAYVDARYISLSKTQVPPVPSKSETIHAKKQITREEEEQKKWDAITKDDVKLRDETLLPPMYLNGPRTFTATVSNDSDFPLSQLHLLTRLYDCSGKPKEDYSNCEIIGEVKAIVPASIPSRQTRLVTGSMMFEATPRVRGTFAWSYRILGVRVE